jgi:Ca2+-transporting ATPase
VPDDAALGDRVDMAFMNTQVTRGAATFVVTATGMATEVGHISGMLSAQTAEETPLTKQLNRLTQQILVIAGVSLLISIGIGLWRGQEFSALFLTAVAFAVSAIPTGLPAVVTTILAAGTSTLASAGAIVKRLRSVETLGSTSAINSDKDRHAHAQPDDGDRDDRCRAALHDQRRGLRDGGHDCRRRRHRAGAPGALPPADGAVR